MAAQTSVTGTAKHAVREIGAEAAKQGAGGVVNNAFNRLFAKKDRKINWQESARYGDRNLQWAKNMWEFENDPSLNMKRLKDAGLNPALMYSEGLAGMGGATQAAPDESYKGMGTRESMQMNLRETEAERALKLAQTRDLHSQADEREGIDREVKGAQIASLLEGVNSEKARQALTAAQTIATSLANKLADETLEDQVDVIRWSINLMAKQYEIAVDDVYISRESRDSKIETLRNQAIISMVEGVLKRVQIDAERQGISKTKMEINTLSQNLVTNFMERKWKGEHNEREWVRLEMEKLKTDHQSVFNVAGRVMKDAYETLYRGAEYLDTKLFSGNR